jgi:hypothetical protein
MTEGSIMKIKEYELAEDIIRMVLERLIPSCILKGEGGLGKSYLANTMCEEHCPDNYIYFSGHITPKQLYLYLYKNKDKIIILDDIEDLLKNDTSIGILKSALWAVKGHRLVSYATTETDGTPTHMQFDFNGGIIILLNKIPRKHNPIIKALESRSKVYDVKLTYYQKIRVMEQILRGDSFYHLIKRELTATEREQLIKDLKANTSMAFENFNFRTMEKFAIDWVYCKKYYPDDPDHHIKLYRATTKIDQEKDLVYKLKNSTLSISEQISKFTNETGKSRATFYRIKKEIENEEKIDKQQEAVSKSQKIKKQPLDTNKVTIDQLMSKIQPFQCSIKHCKDGTYSIKNGTVHAYVGSTKYGISWQKKHNGRWLTERIETKTDLDNKIKQLEGGIDDRQ